MSFEFKDGESSVAGDFSALEKLVEGLSGKHFVDIGILGESNQTTEGGLTLAGLGAVHEFGTDRAGRGNKTVIPERSFIRMPLEIGADDIEKYVGKNYQKNIETGNIKGIFKDIGIAGEAKIQEAFETGGFGEWDDITEETKKRKKSDTILVDQADLKKAIVSKVGGD
jgi:phage gpG-like protein